LLRRTGTSILVVETRSVPKRRAGSGRI